MRRRTFVQTLGASAAWALAPSVFAQAFPTKPTTMVVAFGPGTGSDTVARILAEQMRAILGVPVIVDNKLGGGGVIGTEFVARSAPDGYTLTLGSTSSLGTTPLLNPVAKYRDRDFSFIGGIAKTDYILFHHQFSRGAEKLAGPLGTPQGERRWQLRFGWSRHYHASGDRSSARSRWCQGNAHSLQGQWSGSR